jgi:hypothetical protein
MLMFYLSICSFSSFVCLFVCLLVGYQNEQFSTIVHGDRANKELPTTATVVNAIRTHVLGYMSKAIGPRAPELMKTVLIDGLCNTALVRLDAIEKIHDDKAKELQHLIDLQIEKLSAATDKLRTAERRAEAAEENVKRCFHTSLFGFDIKKVYIHFIYVRVFLPLD